MWTCSPSCWSAVVSFVGVTNYVGYCRVVVCSDNYSTTYIYYLFSLNSYTVFVHLFSVLDMMCCGRVLAVNVCCWVKQCPVHEASWPDVVSSFLMRLRVDCSDVSALLVLV
jgi:hypothetical protein